MKRRNHISIAASLAVVGSFAMVVFAAAPSGAERSRSSAASAPVVAGRTPFRVPPGGAPQPEIDDALSVSQPFFDVSARIPRPYAEARTKMAALAAKYPADPRMPLNLSRLDERLGNFPLAGTEMETYATLAGREPNALRRLAAFYRGRAMAAQEIKTLDELAERLPLAERGPVYRRAIASYNDARPGMAVEPLYEKLVASDPESMSALGDYVSLLLASHDSARALVAIDHVSALNPNPSRDVARHLLLERARVYDSLGQRSQAIAVYERVFDPLWPRSIAADYYALLSRYGLYADRRRALQKEVAGSGTSFATTARLFNFYAYEGNLPAASRLLASTEIARKGVQWSPADLELAANLYVQVDDLDQASRFLYSLYLQNALAPSSPDRARILARLFTALVNARAVTQLAPGGISLYADIARIDPRPGALNGLLSLILAGNNPKEEFAIEEERAGGYFNASLAHTIYLRFQAEYPGSPLLGQMTSDLVGRLASLGDDKDAVAVGTAFLARFKDAKEYEGIAVQLADAHVRMKNRAAERAVLQDLLDRAAARQPANRPLLERSTSRWIYRPEPNPTDETEESVTDVPDPLFIAPNGTPIGADDARRFSEDSDSGSDDEFEPSSSHTSHSASLGENADALTDYNGNDTSDIVAHPTYAGLLERMIGSFEADKKQPAALGFFWNEVKRHPKDEGLMERFLSWLGGTSLFNEQLRAYQLALRQYDDGTWLHRFARWHIQRQRGTQLRQLTEEVIAQLDDESVADFVREFGGYSYNSGKSDLVYDAQFAAVMERVAHARFPNNVAITKLYLDDLRKLNQGAEWMKVAATAYFTDPDIRADYLKALSSDGSLAKAYEQAKSSSSGGLEGGATSAFAYSVFMADSARWLSHFDDAIAAYRRLVELYPGERAYAEPLADLERSLGARDPKSYVEAAGVLDHLAAIYPTDHRYATRAGEALAEAGDMGAAAKRWRSLVATAPGSTETRLEVATVFWDYYQFDDAAAELVAVRTQTHDDSLYSFRLGAVYDSKKDLSSAIPEYVKTLAEDGMEHDRAQNRLAVLSRRDGMLAKIQSAYESIRNAKPERIQLALGYADFLRVIGRTGEAVGVVNREVASTHDVAFLEDARDRLHQWRSPESEERAQRRLIDEARDERERIRARLQLAAFLDQQGRQDDAVAEFDRLVGDNPSNVGVLEEATQYYWRAGKLDKSVDLSKTVIGKAQGKYKKQFVVELARRQVEAKRLTDAEATLRSYFDENALDMDVFSQLAAVLADDKRDADLADLYKTALKRVREANFADYEEDERVTNLRTGMIVSLTKLGRYPEAVDQHIEIVNLYPESADTLDAAFDYAAQHDLTDRLLAYYSKLAKDSYKDFRWSLVLGRLDDRMGDSKGAAEAYRNVVANEPQRVDLRGVFADALVRAGREEDAVAELRRAWEIDGHEPEWLVRVARIRVRQGRPDDAAASIEEAVAARSTLPTSRIFRYAGLLSEWGLLDRSAAMYEKALDRAKVSPGDAGIEKSSIGEYVDVAARIRPLTAVFARLESDRRIFGSGGSQAENYDVAAARQISGSIEEVERGEFARAAIEYGSGEERTALEAAIRSAATSSESVDAKRLYLGIAQAAGLAAGEEAIELQIVDAQLAVADKDKSQGFHDALTELVDMYSRQARFARAAEQLAAYRAKDKLQGDYGYDHRIADAYRLAGDTTNELAALERLYSVASGDHATNGDERTKDAQRLFELLVSTNQRDRLVALAATASPYQYALINFLIERGDKELAARAVATANVSPVWVRAQTAEIGLFFRDASPDVEAAFRDALRARPIGELVSQPFDSKTMLVGSDYYLLARNYGLWLDLVANRPDAARDYIVGRVEQRPRDGGAQAQLARFYLARDNTKLAMAHVDLAEELSPTDDNVIAVRGEVLHAAGRIDDAIAEWTKLLRDDDAGSSEYQLYFSEMSASGHVDRALADLRDVLANRVYKGEYNEVKALVSDMATYATDHPESWPAVTDLIYGVEVQSTDDIQLLRSVLSDELVPLDRRGRFYRLLTDRLEALVAGIESDPDADRGIYIGDDYLYPGEELLRWRKETADYLITQGSTGEALKLLDSVEAERLDKTGSLRGDSEDDDYSWIDLARATIALKAGNTNEAVAAVERYCAPASTDGIEGLPDPSRCRNGVAVLRAGGADAAADAVLESLYRKLLDARHYATANFTGLAEVLYRRGRTDEADATLRRLVARNPDSAENFIAGADAAASAGRFAMAIELREGAGRIARADASNRLELARLRVASGNVDGGAADFVAVVDDDHAPNSIRAQAVDLAAELAASNPSARGALAGRVGSTKTESGRILAALLASSAGDVAAARASLDPLAASGSILGALELGRLELAANRPPQAVAAFERALTYDPTDTIAASTELGGTTPANALMQLYPLVGRPEAALALATARASTYDRDDEPAAADLVFEPTVSDPVAPGALESITARNLEAKEGHVALALASLADAAAELGRLDEAVSYARGRVARADKAERPKAESRLSELLKAQREAAQKASSTLHVSEAVASESVSIRDFSFQ